MLMQAVGDPFLNMSLGILDFAAFRRIPDDAFESRSRHHVGIDTGIEHFAIAGVGNHQSVIGVVVGETLGNAFDRLHQPLLAALASFLSLLQPVMS